MRCKPFVISCTLSGAGVRIALVVLALGTALAMSGCDNSPEVRYVRVKALQDTPSETRTLGAIVPRGSQVWFFKLTGPSPRVEPQKDAFQQLIGSLRFESPAREAAAGAERPQWDLPSGWQQRPGTGMRYATLTHGDGKGQLEISVMQLPLLDEDLDAYVLSNVNRWRDQLSLEPVTADQMSKETETLEVAGTTAVLVDLVGQGSGTAAAGPLSRGPRSRGPENAASSADGIAGSGSAASQATATDRPAASPHGGSPGSSDTAAASRLEYEVPDGWQPGNVHGLRAAAFGISDGERSAEVTVFQMALAANDVLSNVNLWRGQLKLPEVTAEQLDPLTASIEVAGRPATLVELQSGDDAPSPQTILAVIAARNDSVWFFKARGDTELLEHEKPQFLQFVQSVRFKEGQ